MIILPGTGCRATAGAAAETRAGVPLSLIAVLDTDELAPWLGSELPNRLGLVNIFKREPDMREDDLDCQIVLADPARAVEVPTPSSAVAFDRRPLHAAPVITLPCAVEEVCDPVLETLDFGDEPEYEYGISRVERLIRDEFGFVWHQYCMYEQGFQDEAGWFRPDQAFGWPYIDSGLMWSIDDGWPREKDPYTHLLTLSGDATWPHGDGFERIMVPTSALRTGEFGNVVCESDGLH